jgi:hypothetical protein
MQVASSPAPRASTPRCDVLLPNACVFVQRRFATRVAGTVFTQRSAGGIPTSNAALLTARREMGFFNDLKKNLQDEVDKNKELKEALAKYKKDGGAASEAPPKEEEKDSKAEAEAKAQETLDQAKENFAKVVPTSSLGLPSYGSSLAGSGAD